MNEFAVLSEFAKSSEKLDAMFNDIADLLGWRITRVREEVERRAGKNGNKLIEADSWLSEIRSNMANRPCSERE